MKTITIKLLCIALLLCSLFSLYGCCCCTPNLSFMNQVAETSISGTYYLYEVSYLGFTYGHDSLESLGLDPDYCYIRLNSNKTGMLSYDGDSFSIEWDDSQIWPVDQPDAPIDYTVSGNLLTMTIEGVKLVFKKN